MPVPAIQTAPQSAVQPAAGADDTTGYVPVILRPHTMLGVCEAIGEDFGFNPLWLRIPLAAVVLFSPLWTVGAYAALAVAVLASRLLFPVKAKSVAAPAAAAPASIANEADALPLAA